MLIVELVPEEEGGRMVATHVEVQVKHSQVAPNPFGGLVVMGGNTSYDSGVGVALQPGQREFTVLVPVLDVKLIVRSAVHQLDPKKSKYNTPPLGQEAVAPEINKPNRVKIVVSEPG
jgi:hypothetical protein